MKCPYDDLDCAGVDCSGMDKDDCRECNRYNNGIRATGATLVLDWIINKFLNDKRNRRTSSI
jgi:hypothetical protein